MNVLNSEKKEREQSLSDQVLSKSFRSRPESKQKPLLAKSGAGELLNREGPKGSPQKGYL